MSDITTPVSPKDAIIMSLDDGTGRVLIDKNKTDVVYVEPYHIRKNTRAYLNEYDTDAKLNIVRNHREIHYDRIDLNELMEDIATLSPDASDQLCYFIHIPVDTRMSGNVHSGALSDILNQYYDIPVEHTDFDDAILERVKPIQGTMGTIYRAMNCLTTNNELSYTGGSVSRYDDEQSATVSNPGFIVNREWTNGEALTLYPNGDTNKTGWVIEVGFNDDVEYTTPVSPKLVLTQNDGSQLWDVTHDGQLVASFNGNPESGVTIEVSNKTLTIRSADVEVNDRPVVMRAMGIESAPVSIEAPELYKDRGIMRITAYTTNPHPSLYKLGFDLNVTEASDTTGLVTNDKYYARAYDMVLSDKRSNAVVGDIRYPVCISPYRVINYVEKQKDVFKSTNGAELGSIETFVKPEGFNSKKVSFLLDYLDGTLPNDTVSSVTITVTDTRNVNNKYYVKSIAIDGSTTMVGVGPSLNALTYKNVEGVVASEMFNVTITAGNIEVTEGDFVLGNYIAPDNVDSTDISIYKVDIEIQAKPNKTLPNIGVIQTPSTNSNEYA